MCAGAISTCFKMEKFEQLQKLIQTIEYANKNQGWKIAIELRNPSWYNEEVYDLVRQYNICMVIHDLPASATPHEVPTAGFPYLRFHGAGGKDRGSYTDDFLCQYAQHIRQWANEGKAVYFYFNNTMGDAVKNLQTLNGFVLA